MLEPSTYSTETWSFLFQCVRNLLELEKEFMLAYKGHDLMLSAFFWYRAGRWKKPKKIIQPLLA